MRYFKKYKYKFCTDQNKIEGTTRPEQNKIEGTNRI